MFNKKQLIAIACLSLIARGQLLADTQVIISSGSIIGTISDSNNIVSFKGIPFAAPPINELRWKAPQPVTPWQETRLANEFGAQCMQNLIYDDMKFRSSGMSEDCLYLNVWAPSDMRNKKRAVLLYFYGGGFVAGDGSEPRYDGASMAQKDIVVITANYRLGLFGLLAHPLLSAETPYAGSGNYTFLDQVAALNWVVNNIEVFGGDPSRITIAGESAGSLSVSALMASPLSRDLIAGAIGESGSILGPPLRAVPLVTAQKKGEALFNAITANAKSVDEKVADAKAVDGRAVDTKVTDAKEGDTTAADTKADDTIAADMPTLSTLRKVPAELLLSLAVEADFTWFSPTVDGYFLPVSPKELYANNEFSKVPLLAGVNSLEASFHDILGEKEPTIIHYTAALKRLYPDSHEQVFNLYPAKSIDQVIDAAQELASDRFISYGTYRWMDIVTQSSGKPSFYYRYQHIRPESIDDELPVIPSRGATHSAEIEYVLGNLEVNKQYRWQEEDYKVSNIVQQYFANFIKFGDPNGEGLPTWPTFSENKLMTLSISPEALSTETLKERYAFHQKDLLKMDRK